MTSSATLLRLATLLFVAAPLFVGSSAQAQSVCSPSGEFIASLTTWSPPLDRRVSLHARDVSLREALDRVSASTNVRLSYATEAVPLDSRVCASFDSLYLGEALSLLLSGTSVLPVAAGGEHVVLAPSLASQEGDEAQRVPRVLDRVVVTGSAIEAPARRLAIAMNTVSGSQLSRYGGGNLGQALSDAVPGLWLWQTAPTSLLAHYGSIRGTSSFGASYPKIYVDGIELANPLLLTQFTPETVERIEIIRGPQGAALYGTDAISGVINIITRHDGSDGGASAELRTSVGAASSAYVPRSAITQDHAVTIRQGSSAQSATLSLSSGGIGEYVPGAFVRRETGSAGFRLVRSKFIATATGRVFDSRSSDPFSPLFRDSVSAARAGLTTPEAVREYTIGGSTTLVQSERWTHVVVAGFDGSRVSNLADYHTPLPSATGPDLGNAGGSANLITLRASSVAKLGDADNIGANVTFSGESSLLDYTPQASSTMTPTGEPAAQTSIQRRTTAAVTQGNLSWRDAGYLTGGLRVERNDVLGSSSVSVLPMIGGAVVHDYGPLTVKLRSAYGRGIRQAANAARETAWFDPRGDAHRLSLSPEEQSGVEAGVDLFFGKLFGLQVTRFDQLASGLIQRVAYTYTGTQTSGRQPQYANQSEPVHPGDRHIEYSFQNVGEITNRGWELKGDVTMAALSLGGTFSTVDSRVRRVASGYTGDLRVGDRMLEVPARTGSLTAALTGASWTGSLTASRSWDWINYDAVALAGAFSNSTQSDAALVGQELRNYWLRYAGVTRLRASVGRNLVRGLAFTLSGENLLNRQHGEPDNITVVPGRTLSFGLKARL
ncbi:MAG: iron complex outerrane recepter protein [Gemmatimonadaceae bacterium]|nr:iron complex outerrane recepter protein [Gemmatimonadaceae bacterium]